MSSDHLFIAGLSVGIAGLVVGMLALAGPGFLRRRAVKLRKAADKGWVRL